MHEREQSEKHAAVASRLGRNCPTELLFRRVTWERILPERKRTAGLAPKTCTSAPTSAEMRAEERRSREKEEGESGSVRREVMYEMNLQIQGRRQSRRYKVQVGRKGAERDRGDVDRREKGIVWCMGETGGQRAREGGIASMRGIRGGETRPAMTAAVKVAQSRRGGEQEDTSKLAQNAASLISRTSSVISSSSSCSSCSMMSISSLRSSR